MGADVSRIHFVGNVHDSRGMRSFDPASDVRLLSERFTDCGDVALLIVDPIVSAVSGDSHKNTEVRRNLQPLVDLAAMHDCALIGITHYSKGTAGRDPLDRVTGSLAFGALARIVMGTAKPTEAGESRRLVRAKSNIGPDGGGFEYDLDQVDVPGRPGLFPSRVLWGSILEGTARDLLAAVETEPESAEERGAGEDAIEFLRDLLADGPVPSKQVKADADGAGLAWVTIRRAANTLGVKPERVGGVAGRGRWEWSLAPKVLNKSLSCSHTESGTLAKNEHLSTSAPIQWRRVPTRKQSIFDGRGVKAGKLLDTTSDPVSAADYRRASNGE
jgi:putative DNA primase/helicase